MLDELFSLLLTPLLELLVLAAGVVDVEVLRGLLLPLENLDWLQVRGFKASNGLGGDVLADRNELLKLLGKDLLLLLLLALVTLEEDENDADEGALFPAARAKVAAAFAAALAAICDA